MEHCNCGYYNKDVNELCGTFFVGVFFPKTFREGGEECLLVTSEVPLLGCSISKLEAFSLGEVTKYFFHNVHSKEGTEHSQKLEPLEGHTAMLFCECHLNESPCLLAELGQDAQLNSPSMSLD